MEEEKNQAAKPTLTAKDTTIAPVNGKVFCSIRMALLAVAALGSLLKG
jgi:hypothetical protein